MGVLEEVYLKHASGNVASDQNRPGERNIPILLNGDAGQDAEFAEFTQYWDVEEANRVAAAHPSYFVRGRLQMSQKYGLATVYSRAHNSSIHLSNKKSLNRSIHNDDVLVFILEQRISPSKLSHDWNLDDSPSGQVFSTTTWYYEGVVVCNYTALKARDLVLECTTLGNTERKSTHLLYPLDKRYPPITVTAKVPFQANRAYRIAITRWRCGAAGPDGVVCPQSVESQEDAQFSSLPTLDKICRYALKQEGVPFTFPDGHDNSQYLPFFNEAIDQLSRLFNVSREQVSSPEDFTRSYLTGILNGINTDSFRQKLHELGRASFCNDLVFTIDPDTARDFDDAIHISPLIKTKDSSASAFRVSIFEYMEKYTGDAAIAHTLVGFEVGVHIADAAYYLDQCPWLDEMARQTMYSVYFSDRVCPMLPPLFSNCLCSLNPGVPRMVFSVVVQIDTKGMLLPQEVWFGRSVVLSYARLDYRAAQRMINNDFTSADISPTTTSIFGSWPCIEGYAPAIALSVQLANKLAVALRTLRKSYGAMVISMPENRYSVDPMTLVATRKDDREETEAHHLIEELMLVTNCLVAQKLVACFPTLPILRTHPAPRSNPDFSRVLAAKKLPLVRLKSAAQIDAFVKSVAKGLKEMDAEEAAGLANFTFLINYLQKAVYKAGTVTPLKLLIHWGIHTQFYMHFTSPIRRYPDNIAHRLLQLGLKLEREVYEKNKGYLATTAATFRPYKLIVEEPFDLYGKVLFAPPKSLQKLAMTAYNPNMQVKISTEEESSREVLEEQLLTEGLPVGAALKSFSLKAVLNDIKRRYNNKEVAADDEDVELAPGNTASAKPAQQESSRSMAKTIFDQIEHDVSSIGYSFSTLNDLVEKANDLEQKINQIEARNLRAMIRLLINQTPEFSAKGGIDVTAYVISIRGENTVSFYASQYQCLFKMSYAYEHVDAASICLRRFNPSIPVEMQRGSSQQTNKGLAERVPNQDYDVCVQPPEDNAAKDIVIPLLGALKARIVPVSEEAHMGVDLLLTQYLD